MRQLGTLLEGIVADPDERISRLPLMTEAVRRQILVDWNTTVREFQSDRCIHDLFADQAERTRDSVALACGDQRITYGQLNARANQLANYLQRHGVAPENACAISLDRSVDLVVGLLGILKAGGVYVPLEPNYPTERLAFILEDSQALLLLTRKHLLSSFRFRSESHSHGQSRHRDREREQRQSHERSFGWKRRACDLPHPAPPESQRCGQRASGFSQPLRLMWREYPFARARFVVRKLRSALLDSIWEIFGPLLQGVLLVIIPDDDVKDPNRFVQKPRREQSHAPCPGSVAAASGFGKLRGFAPAAGVVAVLCVQRRNASVELATVSSTAANGETHQSVMASSEVAADVTCL